MVNRIVLEYLRINRGNFKIGDLKKKILSSGYAQKEIDEALAQLNLVGKGNVPTVSSTISKINKTNIPQKPVVQSKPAAQPVRAQAQPAKAQMQSAGAQMQPVKKSRKWLWISLVITSLVLIGAAVAVWYFYPDIKALFV